MTDTTALSPVASELHASDLPAPAAPAERHRSRRSGWIVAGAGFVATAALYGAIWHLQSQGRSAAALAMPDMGMQDTTKYWAFPLLQASGLVGLAAAWLSVALGLQQSGRSIGGLRMTYRTIDRLHRQISLLVIVLVAVHVIATAFDAMGDDWRTVLLLNQWGPKGWPAADWGYDAGVIAMYVLAITAPTFYVRRLIASSRWRVLHRFVLVFYVLSVWHALILGVDVGHYGWVRPLVWLAQVPLFVLLARRILQPARAAERRRLASPPRRLLWVLALVVCVAGALGALVIVMTGHSDLIATV